MLKRSAASYSSAAAARCSLESTPIPVSSDLKKATFYRRLLPSSLISFTSRDGKRLFRESLQAGYAENYFSLVGNFTTQSEPAYCGLGSLAMVLNAFELDPGKTWKGAWRWYSDDNLDCSASSVETIKNRGITFREFSCLSKCNGLSVISKRIDCVERAEFVADLRRVCASDNLHMVVSFSRKTMGQTGDGHFSPVGSYHADKDMALILDTARFKYPSYYAPVDLLYEAMKPIDKETGHPRGYFILSKTSSNSSKPPLSLCKLTKTLGITNPKLSNLFCREIPRVLEHQVSVSVDFSLLNALETIFNAVPVEYSAIVKLNDSNSIIDLAEPMSRDVEVRGHSRDLAVLIRDAKSTPLFELVRCALAYNRCLNAKDRGDDEVNVALATVFILALPREVYRTLPGNLISQLNSLREDKNLSPLLAGEVGRISTQLNSLMTDYCGCVQLSDGRQISAQICPRYP